MDGAGRRRRRRRGRGGRWRVGRWRVGRRRGRPGAGRPAAARARAAWPRADPRSTLRHDLIFGRLGRHARAVPAAVRPARRRRGAGARAAAGLIGTWIVLRGLAFYAHAVGTAAFPGLVLADGLGFARAARRAGTGLLVAAGVGWLARREGARALRRADRAGAGRRAGARRHPGQRRLRLGRERRDAAVRQPAARSTAATSRFAAARSPSWSLGGGALLGPRWLIGGLRPGDRARARRPLGLPDAVLLGLVALAAVAALVDARRAAGDRAARRPGGHHAAVVATGCARGSWRASRSSRVEGVGGLWLSVETERAARRGDRRPRRRRLRARRPRRRSRAPAPRAAPPPRSARSRCWRAGAAVGGCASVRRGRRAGAVRVVATTTQLGDLVRAVGGGARRA